MHTIEHNEIFNLAWEVVNHTSCNLFLTGKAGTGKTTFLKYVYEHTNKNAVVVAPTGVAAINASGVTIHSLFQLPLMPFLPEYKINSGNISFVNRYSLFRGIRLSREKIDMLNELELLIIDEVSMVRADLLDMIDESLRHFRNRKNIPFGGVQLLFIGDLYQLPPVIKEEDWGTMKNYYSTPFFFSSKVLENNPMLFLELKEIYRQSEEKFIRILNGIRNNNVQEGDLNELNQRYYAAEKNQIRKGITLVTHNYMADRINKEELQKLKTPLYKFPAEVHGTFSETSFPCEAELHLKAEAQVMFIKNDSEKKYVNGTLAVIKSIDEKEILVELSEDKKVFPLEKVKWKNIRYKLNKETGKIKEEEIGRFTQYPVRLAWAVTIHKSQGLTFDRATIDAGKSFAAGQVYVALSRCRTMEGITLLSPVNSSHIITDKQIANFSTKENKLHDLVKILAEEKKKYDAATLMCAFDWKKIIHELKNFSEDTHGKQLPDKKFTEETVSVLLKNANEQNTICEKFILELEKKFSESQLNEQWLNQKITGAKKFFIDKIQNELISPLNAFQSHLKGKKKVRKFSKQVDALEIFLWRKIKSIERTSFGNLAFEVSPVEKKVNHAEIKKKLLPGGSKLETLNFYKQGLKIEQIAKQREMAISTIEGHLSEFVSTGEINIYDFLNNPLLERIKAITDKTGYEKLSPIKNVLGEEATYGQIKMAVNYLKGISAE
ncbi:MAG: helix-turn-helix domain-containing protein [Bacteroidota bacterium]